MPALRVWQVRGAGLIDLFIARGIQCSFSSRGSPLIGAMHSMSDFDFRNDDNPNEVRINTRVRSHRKPRDKSIEIISRLILMMAVAGCVYLVAGNRPRRLRNAIGEAKAATELSAGHVMGGKVAIGMKNSGVVRPRGDVLNAVARQAANEMDVPSEQRAEFVRDFEWAFNFAWDKSN